MIDQEKIVQEQEKKRKVRQRMRASVDPNNYEYYPERKIADFYDTDPLDNSLKDPVKQRKSPPCVCLTDQPL